MNVEIIQLGGLECRVVDRLPQGASPRAVAILCHGFGAPGTDLVPLAGEMLHENEELASSTAFVFPQAPLSLAAMGMPGGRAWWHIDIEQLNAAIATGAIRDQRKDLPAELPAARQMLSDLVDEVMQKFDLPAEQIALGGFSQGAILATDIALRMPAAPGALLVLSGTLVNQSEWKTLAADRGRLRIFISHGRQDPILPFVGAEWLRDMLGAAGIKSEFLAFDGPHTIPMQAVERMAGILAEIASA